jgi:hypothetical protein
MPKPHVNQALPPTEDLLVEVFYPSQLEELRATLNRAMNTWEPNDQPKWLQAFSDRVDARLGTLVR